MPANVVPAIKKRSLAQVGSEFNRSLPETNLSRRRVGPITLQYVTVRCGHLSDQRELERVFYAGLHCGSARFRLQSGTSSPAIVLELLLQRLHLCICFICRRNLDDANFACVIVAYRNLVLDQSVPPRVCSMSVQGGI